MRSLYRQCLCVLVFVLAGSVTCYAGSAEQQYAIVGTGGVTGVYYPAGGSICRMVNRNRAQHGIRCAVESTQGSIYNLEKVRARDLDFAVVQSDWHFHAVNGSAGFNSVGPDSSLRSLFALYAEPFTVLARRDSGIKSFSDLKGRRVNIGNVGSGQRATMEVLMSALGWTPKDFSEVHELKSVDQAKALCDGSFDAMVFVAGHPSASIKEATTSCDTRLVPVQGAEIDLLVAGNDYYQHVEIPGGMYRGNDTPTKTFGVGATIVSSAEVPSHVIYEVVKAVFDNFESFKQLHPAFEGLSKKEMLGSGLTAPLHDGALKYYREARLTGYK
jgi:uncharacterized protein